jgi:hypothetical protein
MQQQSQQMQALMALLGPMLGAAYGGPMIQNPSGFQNLLAAGQTLAGFIPGNRGASTNAMPAAYQMNWGNDPYMGRTG